MTRGRLQALLLFSMIGLGMLLYGPTLWARAQLNQFNVVLARIWPYAQIIPTEEFCQPISNTARLDDMQATLTQLQAADSHVALHQGMLACLYGDIKSAAAIWLDGLRRSPNAKALLMFAVIANFRQGTVIDTKYAKDIANYATRQSIANTPQDFPLAVTWQEMAFAYHPTWQTASRLATLYRQEGLLDQSREVWVRLQNYVPKDSLLYWRARARELELSESWRAAMTAYLQAAALETSAKQRASAYVQAGHMAMRAHAYDEAASYYALSLESMPERMDAYLGMGEAYRAQGKYDEAARWFARAQALSPEDYRPSFYLGLTAFEAGQYTQALAYFEQALMLKPEHASLLYYKALTLKKLGKDAQAIQLLANAIELHTDPPESWRHQLHRWQEESLP